MREAIDAGQRAHVANPARLRLANTFVDSLKFARQNFSSHAAWSLNVYNSIFCIGTIGIASR